MLIHWKVCVNMRKQVGNALAVVLALAVFAVAVFVGINHFSPSLESDQQTITATIESQDVIIKNKRQHPFVTAEVTDADGNVTRESFITTHDIAVQLVTGQTYTLVVSEPFPNYYRYIIG